MPPAITSTSETQPKVTSMDVTFEKAPSSFRGRNVDPDAWLEQVSKCRYLPENDMVTLCNL